MLSGVARVKFQGPVKFGRAAASWGRERPLGRATEAGSYQGQNTLFRAYTYLGGGVWAGWAIFGSIGVRANYMCR